jgi:hypothetical protein
VNSEKELKIMKKKKSKPRLHPDWTYFMEIHGCNGMWPAGYVGDGVHFWPCGKYSVDTCECELCTKMARSDYYLKKYG